MSLRCLPSSFGSIWLTVWEEMSFEDFQDGPRGGHLGNRNETILAILNLCVTMMPPIKFWLSLTYSLGGYVVWRLSRWPPSRISERNDFSCSEILWHCDASHPVSAQSDLRFGRRCRLKNFKIGTELFLQFWISMLPQCLPLNFSLNPTWLRRCRKGEKLTTDGRTDDGQQAMA